MQNESFIPGKDAWWQAFYNPDTAVVASALVDRNSGNAQRRIYALPYRRQPLVPGEPDRQPLH